MPSKRQVTDEEYYNFLEKLNNRFQINSERDKLFTTNSEGLFCLFLEQLHPDIVQHYTCRCCQNFVDRFGGLVTIGEDGKTSSALWGFNDPPYALYEGIATIKDLVEKQKVTGVFYSNEYQYGSPATNGKDITWRHMAAKPHKRNVWDNVLQTADQRMAEQKEDFKNIVLALMDYPLELLTVGLKIVNSDTLYGNEKIKGQMEWLYNLSFARENSYKKYRDNTVWKAIAEAPAGFLHPRASMVGTLLTDLKDGYSYDDAAARFKSKMHPLQYMRPTAPPKDGTIVEAEKVFSVLESAGALARRFCRLDEVQLLWQPVTDKSQPIEPSLFGHLKSKPQTGDINTPATKITWEKFRRTVLPNCTSIEINLPSVRHYLAPLVTAVHPEAPCLFQWNNHVSWYIHTDGFNHGSYPHEMNINPGWTKLSGIGFKPFMWEDEEAFEHQGHSVLFYLQEAFETKNMTNSCLFPSLMKSEYHGIRSVIEAYSKRGRIEPTYGKKAVGIVRAKTNQDWQLDVRCTVHNQVYRHLLDRWD